MKKSAGERIFSFAQRPIRGAATAHCSRHRMHVAALGMRGSPMQRPVEAWLLHSWEGFTRRCPGDCTLLVLNRRRTRSLRSPQAQQRPEPASLKTECCGSPTSSRKSDANGSPEERKQEPGVGERERACSGTIRRERGTNAGAERRSSRLFTTYLV